MRGRSGIPSWLEPPSAVEGSIDPLGDQAYADALADQLLPGVTVATLRARYLSFLCWARESGLDEGETDHWEAALAAGEFLRHRQAAVGEQARCVYLGIRTVEKRIAAGRVPRSITKIPSRRLYAGLLRSAGLVQGDELTDLGQDLAWQFGRNMPRRRRPPARASSCRGLPCLSDVRGVERRRLRQALLSEGPDARVRAATLKEVGVRGFRAAIDGTEAVLRRYLGPLGKKPPGPAGILREAAVFELTALPFKALFLHLYINEGALAGSGADRGRPHLFRVRSEGRQLWQDVRWHLERNRSLGGRECPRGFAAIRDRVLEMHQEAKADAPWVDGRWQVLRPGLELRGVPGVHGFRLRAFASLLRDVGVVR